MKEINKKQIQEVNGGYWNFVVGYLGGKAIDAFIDYSKNPTPVLVRENDGSDPLL
ncbi:MULTISPECIES: hypothetical protein [Pseudoalteromonas]|uniref:hypothetical protein n=1 Tax=Pseudoalteromonas TaxID=53246 RepID=UPI0019D0DDB6|nr:MULTISPECIES: hypothetical protein [Pseudoalteromonas]MBR8845661.1 hypothetical protein [Pseudoalteromonas sp. JC3]MCF7514542.1 hypothetical protein [Pseudoalteromonas sp. L7]MCF7526679.1 hypothetical protein [Pseudoalteromonas sp. L23]MCX2766389.1 hypothetical protein [Pseudoalteromonas sp. B530]QUI72655.1 hypothetical protein GSF13_24385 [Pseudoalteromonas sp. M8]